jgi:hypothetical protein
MPILDVFFKSISQPILDPDNPSYAFSPKSHDDPMLTFTTAITKLTTLVNVW